ncbi:MULTISPECIES: GFA family protein [unclassified Aureimonas]|uniref:GFA family protein n=1 Tax=unclassified Aureimonas TaxID=2615206 RepID=UPI0006F97A07|nr:MULTISPECIES: GFA family protein [unclassified Aureimonas]KQT52908.1 aldehyde-activating protein [Aureimonas sp. Leaf427]KQT80367.1 aldehyde-activating protein [Aureimonas sp. Leaf460]
MGVMSLPAEGGCRCGEIRFRLSAAPVFTAVCHCSGCQRMSGSAFSTTISVPSDGFSLLCGAPVIGGLHGPQARHHHCPHCKSWIFTRIEPDMGFVNVRATALDDAAWFEPFLQTYTSEALPWALVAAPHSYPRFPDMADFPALVAEFAATQRLA